MLFYFILFLVYYNQFFLLNFLIQLLTYLQPNSVQITDLLIILNIISLTIQLFLMDYLNYSLSLTQTLLIKYSLLLYLIQSLFYFYSVYL